ncbi:hypothetical protein MVEN_01137900 [Mycena venus]|uniref:Tyr recombinase domain-containing protein n=1 Tax=Mycena venus TaxID=2733690 RepID=A0A8H6Y9U4_9AGAR|nr:hypothetical protein MVEN_01137900 [Mycena venus]
MPALRRSSRAKASSVTISSARNAKSHTTTKAASGKKSSRKAAKPVQATATSDLPSTLSLLENSRQTTDEWLKSKRTKKGYGNYVKGGKKWLVEWTAEGRLDDEISEDAFDVMSEQTPLALRALTAYKCEHLARRFASAEGIRSAFKDYFERVCGCQGDFWKYNSHNQKWEGNPVFESGFKTYYESLKNRHNRTSTATQALPMLPADLKVIMEYLDSPEAIKYFTVTQRLYFKTFVTTAFTLWTRNDELINLQFKDIKLNLRSKTGIPYHEFSLIFRKTNKDPTKVQKYMVQIDPAHPEIDCYTHVEAWKAHMERLLGRRLAGTDYVFPALASTGQIKFGEPTSRSAFETLLDEVVDKSNVLQGRNGRFTTHCFRRGGAQYRFLWADRKWSLKAVKWWGGWSSNENVGTLMRYLLDELMAYEEGFSDIMMDDRVIDRHETFMGEDERVPVSKADLLKFEDSILTKIRGMIAGVPAPPIPASTSAANASVRPAGNGTPATRAETPVPPPASPTNDHITPSPYVPQPSRIPETKTLDDALTYWEHGAPQKGLDVPLKEWATLFKSSEYTSEAVKLGNIRFVCEEFRIHCNGDFAVFEEKFPGMRRKFTMLMKSVRAERKLRGEAKSRNSRK